MGRVEEVEVEGWRELQEIVHVCVRTADDCEHAVKAVGGGDRKKKRTGALTGGVATGTTGS